MYPILAVSFAVKFAKMTECMDDFPAPELPISSIFFIDCSVFDTDEISDVHKR